MRADEWFISDQVLEVFLAFLKGTPFPENVQWRPSVGF